MPLEQRIGLVEDVAIGIHVFLPQASGMSFTWIS
jgi:hypothetical protein